jgi:hypothetical protein
MTSRADKGTWVEVHHIILEPRQRAPQTPSDTRQVPLEMKVKGTLVRDAVIGADAEIITSSGRRVVGTLIAINPAYCHGYGAPIPELSHIGSELREILRKKAP